MTSFLMFAAMRCSYGLGNPKMGHSLWNLEEAGWMLGSRFQRELGLATPTSQASGSQNCENTTLWSYCGSMAPSALCFVTTAQATYVLMHMVECGEWKLGEKRMEGEKRRI